MSARGYRVVCWAKLMPLLALARRDYPNESACLVAYLVALEWGAVSPEELRACGKLVWSERDGTEYLYQHVTPGRICLSVTADDVQQEIRVNDVIHITYERMLSSDGSIASDGIVDQLSVARRCYPSETAGLVAYLAALEWGAVTLEEARARGRLVCSKKDGTEYLYQHVTPGRVCFAVGTDEEHDEASVTGVVEISYQPFVPRDKRAAINW